LGHWRLWLKKRKHIQAMRTVKDRDLLKTAVSQIIFDEKTINNPLLKYIGNPMMAGYWWIVKKIIVW
ncbi:MAG: hypothetical protein Q7S24_00910, partial [bacterium]|nr:hypothetical protein [bacterium]